MPNQMYLHNKVAVLQQECSNLKIPYTKKYIFFFFLNRAVHLCIQHVNKHLQHSMFLQSSQNDFQVWQQAKLIATEEVLCCMVLYNLFYYAM